MTGSRYDCATTRFRGVPSMAGGMFVTLVVIAGIWWAALEYLPPFSGMGDVASRLGFALECICVAVVFCFLTGIEAISHERLQTDAFDPLAGHTTQPLQINARYVQNNLEQLILFAPGLLVLAHDADGGGGMRMVVAATIVWILTRYAFWIGYHFGPQYRAFGLAGMAQSLLVLIYAVARFGYDLAGPVGAIVPVLTFGAIEVFLVRATRQKAADHGA